jgi:uncharacterized membrane protein
MIAAPYVVGQQWPASRYAVPVAGLAAAIGYAGWELPLAEISQYATGMTGQAPDLMSLPGYRQEVLSDYAVLGVCLALIGGLLGIAGTLLSSARAPLAVAGSFLPILIVAVAYARVEVLQISMRFAILSLLVGMAALSVADYAKRRLADDAVAKHAAVASWLIAALTALVLGLCMVFDRGVLTVALGLVAAIVALVYQRYPLVLLRPVAVLAALLWFARIAWDPAIVGGDLGTTPIFNWLLFGYGVPAAGFVLAAWLLGRHGRDIWLEAMEAVAILAVAVSLAVLGLHALDPGQLFSPIDTLAETAMLVVIGGGMALGLLRLSHRRNGTVIAIFADGLGILGMAVAAVGLLLVYNPIWTGDWIGSGLFLNVLLFAYFLTGLIYAAVGYFSSGSRVPHYNISAIVLSGLLLFAWVSLTIRQGFHRGNLNVGETGDAELYVYSAVWLVIGIVMLVAGLASGRRFLRLLSGVIIVAVVLKVFVVDMSNLAGFLRALSFIGLGAVLVGIGLIYQRLLRRAG